MFDFRPSLLDRNRRLFLKAAISSGQPATEAFRAWRAAVPFDDLTHATTRAIPLLVDLVIREKLNDPDFLRMKGIERHIWASNTLKFRALFKALTVIQKSGTPFVLMKGGALIARMPKSAGVRTSGDYDILVEPSRLVELVCDLKAAGFEPKGFALDDLDGSLQNSVAAGAPITLAGSSDEIDIHWRPLPRIHDQELTNRIFRNAGQGKLHDKAVPVPSFTHHLFLCLARCEPWDKDECLTRLMEAHFLLSAPDASIDWDELKELVARYGLETLASAFFDELSLATGVQAPSSMQWQDRSWSIRERLNWNTMEKGPDRRAAWRQAALLLQETEYRQHNPSAWTPAPRDVWLLARSHLHARSSTALLWQSISQRVHGVSSGKIRFLHGFSYPEIPARWTEGHLAFMAVPLTDRQKAGEPVRIHADGLSTGWFSRVVMAGGLSTKRLILWKGMRPVILSIPLRPLDALGGDGLLLLWLPDAISPKSAGLNEDRRVLSLYIHRAQPDLTA